MPVDICVVGSVMTDLVARAARLPAPGETLFGSSFQQGFGGKGANQAVMAARLGARVGMIARLGRDPFGEAALRNLQAEGVDTTGVAFDDARPSGVALISVAETTGQNAITIVPGANHALSVSDVQRAAATIQGAKVVVAQLETPVAATLEAFRLARAVGASTLLNPAPAAALPAELLALTDLLVPNELEAAGLTGREAGAAVDPAAVAAELLTLGPKTVVVTLGERGALLAQAGAPPQELPAEAVTAVDTTGAGDAFIGALAYFLACAPAQPLAQAVARSCQLASWTVQREGTQTSYPQRDEVAALLG
jgi:ribokinase